MEFEKYISLYNNDDGFYLKPMKNSFELEFELDKLEDKEYYLHTVGETSLFYQWRNELNYPELYTQITDALDSEHAEKAQFCIDFSSPKPERFAKRIYKKEITNPVILSYIPLENPEEIWNVGIFLKGENVKVEKGGYLRLRVDISYADENKSPFDTVLSPDETHIIDFQEGTFDYMCVEKSIEIKDEKVSSFGIWIEGLLYSGKLYIENPFLTNSGYNLINDFYAPVSNRENFNWTGQNLSKKEWPAFRVKLNGENIFEGEVFERCHRYSEWEISLPEKYLKNKNTLSYELISKYHNALSYNIYSAGILEQKSGVFSVVANSFAVAKGKDAFVLIKTTEDNLKIDISYNSENISGEKSVFFKEKGLHGIKIFCKDICKDANFSLKCKDVEKQCTIPYIIEKKEDNILLGTGDMVYVNQNLTETEKYLCWYLSNRIGNFVTIRPVYRWSGTRVIDDETIFMLKRVLSELGIKYVLMTDGRELSGLCCNPTDDMLNSELFLGRQNHERDGKAYYWGVRDKSLSKSQIQFYDMMTCERKENECFSQFPPKEYSYKKDGIYSAVEPDYPTDVRKLEKLTVKRLETWRTASRHTGPSYMQKYLAKAGYTFLGAETMYSNTEMLLAIMRGVQKAFDMKGFGVHHALQWSTTPHDDEAKYRRFYLALYLSYMLGASDINTEEGLWRLEEFFSTFNRFSAPCKEYIKIHQKFLKYIQTHSRRGKFYTPFAFIHGRCDGTLGFGEGNMWGLENLGYTDAEESWKLANIFYPKAKINDCIYAHPCPCDKEIGFYSGTPFGNVDIIPIEAGKKAFDDYKVLAFLGYNLKEENDFKALKGFVSGGGMLLLTLAHLTTTTNLYDVKSGLLSFDDANKETEFKAEVLELTDEKKPLVLKYNIGKGSIILFNTSVYPGNPSIKGLYEKYLEKLMKEAIKKEEIWVKADETVEFSVYEDNGLKTIYLLAVDWFEKNDYLRCATLKAGGFEYKIEIPFGTMIKCVSNGEKSVWTLDENGEILDLNDEEITVQGTDFAEFIIAEGGRVKKVSVDFSKDVIKKIK